MKSSADIVKPEKPYSNLTRIQGNTVPKNEKANVNISNLSTLPLCSNIKSIRPVYIKPTQNQSPLMLGSSLKALAAPISLLAAKSKSPSIPSTTPTLLNSTAHDLAKVMFKKKSVAPISSNEQLLSNMVKREMISSTPSTTCTSGTSFNNLQLLYPSQTKFEQVHTNAINPPQTQATVQQHGQFQRSKEYKPQQYELHQTQKKFNSEQLQKVPQNQQKYIINTTKRSAEPYSTNYSLSKIKV